MADSIVTPSLERKQSVDKKFAGSKIELTSHLTVACKLMGGVPLWVKSCRRNKRGSIISEECNNGVK